MSLLIVSATSAACTANAESHGTRQVVIQTRAVLAAFRAEGYRAPRAYPDHLNHVVVVYQGPAFGVGLAAPPWDEPKQVVAIRFGSAAAATKGLALYRSINPNPPLSHFAKVTLVCNVMLDESIRPETAAADRLYERLKVSLRRDC